MRNYKKILCFLLTIIMLFILPACGGGKEEPEGESIYTEKFSYSDGLDENGFWENIRALDYVEIFNYKAFSIPADVHTISEEKLKAGIDKILSEYYIVEKITDRAVKNGDTVNIDYVGSVDGVEFSGGSTGGRGTEVTIGVTSYIDDFLEQLIGHMPGETINVEVTFPAVYQQQPSLQGKDAVFVTTINYIAGEKILPELTDDFVADNFLAGYGWSDVAQMKDGVRRELQREAVQIYLGEYFVYDVDVKSIPDKVLEYQNRAMVNSYREYARKNYVMELEEYLKAFEKVSSAEELVAKHLEENKENAKYFLVIQAVAEDAGIKVNTEDLVKFFEKYMKTSDYSSFEGSYGLPYLKQAVLSQKILDYIFENAVLL